MMGIEQTDSSKRYDYSLWTTRLQKTNMHWFLFINM